MASAARGECTALWCTQRCRIRCMARRLSVTLEHEEERVVETFGSPSTPEHAALLEWAAKSGIDRIGSDASLVRALIRAGAEALRKRVLDIGYAALAIELGEVQHDEVREARRRYIDRSQRAGSE
jgi:hypothetical protein